MAVKLAALPDPVPGLPGPGTPPENSPPAPPQPPPAYPDAPSRFSPRLQPGFKPPVPAAPGVPRGFLGPRSDATPPPAAAGGSTFGSVAPPVRDPTVKPDRIYTGFEQPLGFQLPYSTSPLFNPLPALGSGGRPAVYGTGAQRQYEPTTGDALMAASVAVPGAVAPAAVARGGLAVTRPVVTAAANRPLLTGALAAQGPALMENVVQGVHNPGQPRDATSRLVAPENGGLLSTALSPLSAVYTSAAQATGLDPLARAGLSVPVRPDDPGLGAYVGRTVGNFGDLGRIIQRSPEAVGRRLGYAAGDLLSNTLPADRFPSTARQVGGDLAATWKALPGSPTPSPAAYEALPGDPPSLAAMGGLGGIAAQRVVDQNAEAGAARMLASDRVNNPELARQRVFADEAVARLKAERPDLAPALDAQLREQRMTEAAIPRRAGPGALPESALPSRRDMEDARAYYGRPGTPSLVGPARAPEFEKNVEAFKNLYTQGAGSAPGQPLAQAPAQPPPPPTDPGADRAAGFQSLRQRLGYTGAVPPAFAASVPAMNTVLDAAEKASVDPQDLVGGMQTAGKAIAAAAEDPKALARLEKAPPPHDFVQDVMKRPDVASGEVDPKEAVASAWAGMGSGARILLGAGLGTAALGLLMNLFGGDDEDGKGGSSFLWKVLPLLGLGAAAWGLASTDDITNPSFSRLADKKTWVGLGNDVGLGGLLGARR